MLHRYDWSESSLILEVFTRHHGRIALVAKGAKRPSSNFRPVLLPLQPLQLNFSGDAEIRTLKGAEWMGGQVMPTGEALLSGYYLNELLLRLLARDDPHEALFDAYAAVVQVLAERPSAQAATQPALRAFELLLLREIGLLPSLDAADADPGAAGRRRRATAWCPRPACARRATARPGAAAAPSGWRCSAALDDRAPFRATLQRVRRHRRRELKPQLRTLLQLPLRRATLRTRQMMMDLQAL